ncbi:hypothetical protein AAZX31_08G231200 [Glycine max]|uniref:Uncharacterized protein n=2 Tax=Glycine subgen. Soja TaxID=1462606 RepID=K7L8E5_SOYBN|nr:hypothetical protein JHK87_022133 [Glycine soja]KAG5016559.1 hypothetical protein JHK85_022695 [Glycine max]KAG5026322.1 hypothetical protein JHK86_022236 [Glycine max]KAG5137479.1 hypothetical protein JHK82_022210 [Glycine max]KAH1052737.1 hypothetical protein GYH30_022172 [Glycine max]
MDHMLTKKFKFLIYMTLLSTSFIIGESKLINNLLEDENSIKKEPLNEEEVSTMQEMLLRANVRDYGRFDPPPGHVQPPSKGIPAAAPDPNHPPPPPGNGGCK